MSLLQLSSEVFELCFGSQGSGKAHLHFEFDYDFERFINEEDSNYHDVFVRESKLLMNVRAKHFLKEFRRLFMV